MSQGQRRISEGGDENDFDADGSSISVELTQIPLLSKIFGARDDQVGDSSAWGNSVREAKTKPCPREQRIGWRAPNRFTASAATKSRFNVLTV